MTKRRAIPILVAAIAAAAVFAYMQFMSPALAGAVFQGTTPGVAINGYDPVGYFEKDAAVKGSAAHSAEWNGVLWHFASDESRATFLADPARYAPQYGGYCAFAAARGQLAKTEPDAFTVYNDKLYLNFDQPIKRRWESERDKFVETANENWPELEEQAAAR